LAFIPLTFSVLWGWMAFTLIGGTDVGTVLTLLFLPALYSIWFGVKPTAVPPQSSFTPTPDDNDRMLRTATENREQDEAQD